MKDAERIFVDTNVLLAATDRSRHTHQESVQFLEKGVAGEVRLFTCGQVLREYLVVATRPVDVNGLGIKADQACENVAIYRSILQLLPETTESYLILEELIRKHSLEGKRIHDANLVAVMTSHGLRHLKTWNPKDFEAFSEVEIAP